MMAALTVAGTGGSLRMSVSFKDSLGHKRPCWKTTVHRIIPLIKRKDKKDGWELLWNFGVSTFRANNQLMRLKLRQWRFSFGKSIPPHMGILLSVAYAHIWAGPVNVKWPEENMECSTLSPSTECPVSLFRQNVTPSVEVSSFLLQTAFVFLWKFQQPIWGTCKKVLFYSGFQIFSQGSLAPWSW